MSSVRADHREVRRAYKPLRDDENWAWLRETSASDYWDPIKYLRVTPRRSDLYLTIGGEVRLWGEFFQHEQWGSTGHARDGAFLQRYMLHADAHLTRHLRVFVQLKSGLAAFQEDGPGPVDQDLLDFNQLYLDLIAIPGATLDDDPRLLLRGGRQELSFGSGRLVEVREGPNVRFGYDGIRLIARPGRARIDAFALLPPVRSRRRLFPERFDALLQQSLVAELQQRGYTLVERRLLDKVLAEVKLGSSELADADTQIKLGRVLAARLMVSGQLVPGAASGGGGLTAALRAIDTETTQLALVRSEPAGDNADAQRLAATLAQAIARTVAERYPLKGRIAAVDGDRVVLNLGKRHGLVSGQQFNVLLRGAPIELNGKVLGYQEQRIAQLQVTDVEEGLAYARIAERTAPLEKNQRVIARTP